MAAITSANVTVIRSWTDASRGLKEVQQTRQLAIVLSAQGATIGDIPASALGFAAIYEVRAASLYTGGLSKGALIAWDTQAGTELIPTDPNQATDANRINRASLTGTLYATVSGRGL